MLKCYSMLIILIFALASFAKIYYVDGTTGNNTYDGLSELSAWKTIGNANRLVKAGDTVYIKKGIYTEYIKPISSGESAKPILYSRFKTDTVVIQNASYGIVFENVKYVTVKNINFTNIDFYILIWKGSSFNTINGCKFDKMRKFANWAGCRILGNSKYNKIINSSISHYGMYDNLAKGAVIDIGTESSRTDSSFYNLVEKCTIYHGGHHVLGLYSSYNVIKNNYIHNEPWYNGYGERNIILNGYDECSGWNLIEGNRIAFAGLPPDGTGGSGIAVVSKNNIIRRNIIYKNNAAGVMLGATSSYASYPYNNKIYNNTILFNGYNTRTSTGSETKCGIGFANYGNANIIAENDIINNIIYKNGNSKAFGFFKVDSTRQYFAGNWIGTGDPLFNNITGTIDPKYSTIPNVKLQDGSPCVDRGTFLTQIISANGSGTTFAVNDAGFFTNGFKITTSDTIQLEKSQTKLKIISINYKTKTITVNKTVTWYKNQGVSLSYNGPLPDMGAIENMTYLAKVTQKNVIPNLQNENINNKASMVIYDLSGRKMKETIVNGNKKADMKMLHNQQSKGAKAHNVYLLQNKSNDKKIEKFTSIK